MLSIDVESSMLCGFDKVDLWLKALNLFFETLKILRMLSLDLNRCLKLLSIKYTTKVEQVKQYF